MHSPEVELTEIFLSYNLNGNGLVPLDIAPDTKNTNRGVHKFCKVTNFIHSHTIGQLLGHILGFCYLEERRKLSA